MDSKADDLGEPRTERQEKTEKIEELAISMTIDEGWHTNSNQPSLRFLIATRVELSVPDGVVHGDVDYPEGIFRQLEFGGETALSLYEGRVEFTAPISVSKDSKGGDAVATVHYQACSHKVCLRPASKSATVVIAAPSQDEEAIDDTDAAATGMAVAKGIGPGSGTKGDADWFSRLVERGWWVLVPAMLLIGLGLNLTPCVYPLISITVAYFGGQAEGSASRRIVLALLYVLGLALTFSAMGVTAALSGSVFGAALTHPGVNIALAALMMALALSSFGVYQFKLPEAWTAAAGGSGQGAAGALFMGATMGVVAAPCVGPVVVGLMLFVGARGDALLGLGLFFLLALGLGLPYLVLAMLAGSISSLPKSGAWLEWVEHLFGCMLVAMAIYFLRPVLPDSVDRVVMPAFLALAAVYLGFLDRSGSERPFFWFAKYAGGALALVGLLIFYSPAADGGDQLEWAEFSTAAYDAARTSGRPFVIEFSAEWCLPCKEMEESTFKDARVIKSAKDVQLLSVDMTTTNDFIDRVVSSFEVLGAPTIIFYDREGREHTRRVGFVGANDFAGLLEASGA